MTRQNGRDLSGPEIDLTLHLLKSGAAATPVRVVATAIKTAMRLRKLGVVDAWSKYVEGRGSEGPFFTLTRHGAYRAESLYLSRRRHAAAEASTLCSLRTDQSEPPQPGDDP